VNRKTWTPKEVAFVGRVFRKHGLRETAALFSERFGCEVTQSQIRGVTRRYKLHSLRDGRFAKGHKPHNAGQKGWCPAGSERGWFSRGSRPHNACPVGTERDFVYTARRSYTKVKVAEPNKWRFKHHLVWEQKYGPVPQGYAVIFGDGNVRNFKLNNLILVSRGQLATMSKKGYYFSDAKMTRVGAALALLDQKNRALKLKNRRPSVKRGAAKTVSDKGGK